MSALSFGLIAVIFCFFGSCDAQGNWGNIELRLTNGPTFGEGRLEMLNPEDNTTWGSVCDVRFTREDARVACRQMGFANGHPHSTANYGEGSDLSMLRGVECTGVENSLMECNTEIHQHYCYQVVGVQCYNSLDIEIAHGVNTWLNLTGIVYVNISTDIYTSIWTDAIRLSNREARVVCRQMGWEDGMIVQQASSTYGVYSGLNLRISCCGDESNLAECLIQENHFQSNPDVFGVSCSNDSMTSEQPNKFPHCEGYQYSNTSHYRLVGGSHPSNGQVQARIDNRWVNVGVPHGEMIEWDKPLAKLVCHALGYTSGDFSGYDYIAYNVYTLYCCGNETDPSECRTKPYSYYNKYLYCNTGNSTEYAPRYPGCPGFTDGDGEFRIVGGNIYDTFIRGYIQRRVDDTWHTLVSGYNLYLVKEVFARAACHHFGYNTGYETYYGISYLILEYPKLQTSCWCGDEDSLNDCLIESVNGNGYSLNLVYCDMSNDHSYDGTFPWCSNFNSTGSGARLVFDNILQIQSNSTDEWHYVVVDGQNHDWLQSLTRVTCNYLDYSNGDYNVIYEALPRSEYTAPQVRLYCCGKEYSPSNCENETVTSMYYLRMLSVTCFDTDEIYYKNFSDCQGSYEYPSPRVRLLRYEWCSWPLCGLIQVNHDGMYYTVSGRLLPWSSNLATIICKQNGYTSAWYSTRGYQEIPPSERRFADVFCCGGETRVEDCYIEYSNSADNLFWFGCDTAWYGSWTLVFPRVDWCPGYSYNNSSYIRLISDDNVTSAGFVQLLTDGYWQTVDEYRWNNFVNQACMQLGYIGGFSWSSGELDLPRSKTHSQDISLYCSGDEQSFFDCQMVKTDRIDRYYPKINCANIIPTCTTLTDPFGAAPCASDPCLNGGVCSERYDTFSCRCPPEYGGMFCEKRVTKDPFVEEVTPSFGPLSGGTILTIVGQHFAGIAYVFIGHHVRCDVTSSNVTHGFAVTPMTGESLRDKTNPIIVEFHGEKNVTTRFEFVYKGDPDIDSIHPLTTIIEGGTTLTVTGTSMDSVAQPVLEVTLDMSIRRITDKELISRNETKFTEFCSPNSSTRLLCKTPKIPKGLLSSNDTGDGFFRSTQLYIGLLFDGLTNFTDLRTNPDLAPYSRLEVLPTPQFMSDQINNLMEFIRDTSLEFKGTHISTLSPSDYIINVGTGECRLILPLLETSLFCMPPQETPKKHEGDDYHAIIIHVGKSITHHVGYLKYPSVNLPVIIGCSVGVIILVLIIIIIPISLRRRQRNVQSKATSNEIIHLPPVVNDLTENINPVTSEMASAGSSITLPRIVLDYFPSHQDRDVSFVDRSPYVDRDMLSMMPDEYQQMTNRPRRNITSMMPPEYENM